MPETSNRVGLRIVEELTPGVLNGDANDIWYPLDPNDYGDFGGEKVNEARTPISADRQRRKGSIVDENASASFGHDFVQKALYRPIQGFMYADWREKQNDEPTAVTALNGYAVPDGTLYPVGSLIFGEGFAVAGNNGLRLVTANAAGTVNTAESVDEPAPPAGAKITLVGVQGAAGDIDVDAAGTWPALTSTTLDFTTLGYIPGEWIFIGGDAVGVKYANAGNNGYARIYSIAANRLEFDRTTGTFVTEASAAETIQLFTAHVIKNESDPALIVERSYQLERDLATQGYEYLPGSYADSFSIRVNAAAKVTVQLGFNCFRGEIAAAAKPGTRPSKEREAMFSSSSDFSRMRMLNDTASTTLFTFISELSVNIQNNVTPNKAIGTLGAIDMSVGDFVVDGRVLAYFSSKEAVDAINANDDVSLDFVMAGQNAGWLFDLPLVTLKDGRAQVVKDRPIMLPLGADAVAHPDLDHTLLVQCFTYLPTAAM